MTDVSKEIRYVDANGRLTYDGMALLKSLVVAPTAPAWGDITGTLSDQTDLQTALELRLADRFTYSASQATTAGTAFDFTGVPADVSEVVLDLTGVSLNGSDDLLVQLGVSGGPVVTGYGANGSNSLGTSSYLTTGFPIIVRGAAIVTSGRVKFDRVEGNLWSGTHIANYTVAGAAYGSGTVTLSGELTQVRLTRTGANTFDAGSARLGWR